MQPFFMQMKIISPSQKKKFDTKCQKASFLSSGDGNSIYS